MHCAHRTTRRCIPWALITDDEQAGLIGAYAFLENPALRERIGAVVNVDARGTRGPSLLFQTSPGDGRLIDLYAGSVTAPDTSSLYAEIYRRLPNDTDLTPFLEAGVRLRSIDLGGQHLTAPLDWHQDTWVRCLSRDCQHEEVSLSWTGQARELQFAEERYGLPPSGAFLEQARAKLAMPLQAGDEVMLVSERWH